MSRYVIDTEANELLRHVTRRWIVGWKDIDTGQRFFCLEGDDAWKKNVLLVSSSTLLFVLRTVAHLWRQEQQNKNAQDIANPAQSAARPESVAGADSAFCGGESGNEPVFVSLSRADLGHDLDCDLCATVCRHQRRNCRCLLAFFASLAGHVIPA